MSYSGIRTLTISPDAWPCPATPLRRRRRWWSSPEEGSFPSWTIRPPQLGRPSFSSLPPKTRKRKKRPPTDWGRQEKEGRPNWGGQRVQEGKDPSSGLLHQRRRRRRGVAAQGQAPSEIISIRTPEQFIVFLSCTTPPYAEYDYAVRPRPGSTSRRAAPWIHRT